jgi:uncharacterized protein (DUF779 family)
MSEVVTEPRVVATEAALDLIREIQVDHPEILFHQSGAVATVPRPCATRPTTISSATGM